MIPPNRTIASLHICSLSSHEKSRVLPTFERLRRDFNIGKQRTIRQVILRLVVLPTNNLHKSLLDH